MRISDWSSDVCSSDLAVSRTKQSRRTGRIPMRYYTLTEVMTPLARAALGGVAAAVIGAASFGAVAQDKFPSDDIEIVSHASPGGGTDITARMWMDAAAEILGQDLVIVYKQGGGARSAHEYAMAQPADGYVVVAFTPRSAEHTSELQSLMRISYAVF